MSRKTFGGHSPTRWLASLLGLSLVALAVPTAAAPAQAAPAVSTVSAAAATPTGKESEPNDSMEQANVIKDRVTYSGSLAVNTEYSQDQDFFVLDAPHASTVSLRPIISSKLRSGDHFSITIRHSFGYFLYGRTVDSTMLDGKRVASDPITVPKGRLYIEIAAFNTTHQLHADYEIQARLTPGNVESEFNDRPNVATPVTPGVSYSGSSAAYIFGPDDTDVFVFDAPRGGQAALNFTFPAHLGAGPLYEVSVTNSHDKEILHDVLSSDDYNGTRLRNRVLALQPGRYYVEFTSYMYWASWLQPYQFRTELHPFLTSTPTPTVTGTTSLGSTLTAHPGTWKPACVKFTYQWKRNGKAISGAKYSTHKTTTADLGKNLTVTVKGSKATYASVSKTSKAKAIPLRKLASTPTPRISGTATAGKTLKVTTGTWKPSGVKLKIQWKRNGKSISHATKSSYKLTSADRGKRITVTVTGSKATYKTVAKTSSARTVRR